MRKKIIFAVIALQHSKTKMQDLLLGIPGIAGSQLYALPWGNIAAVLGDYSNPNSKITRDLLLDYARIVEDLFGRFTLLPFQFGSFWNSDESVMQMLSASCESFQKNLHAVEYKSEFSLKVILDHSVPVDGSDIESLDYDALFTRQSEHTDYLLRKIREHQQDQARNERANKLVKEITGLMNIEESSYKLKNVNSKHILFDGVFLIKRDRMEDAVRIVDEVSQKYSSLYFLMTGPWPPYSFTEIKLS